MTFGGLLRQKLRGLVPVSDEVAGVLEQHYGLMLRWNRKLNLTTVTALEEAVERHYAESLLLAARISGGMVCDIGSGAGFPGFPVAAYLPSASVVLVESDQRKAAFLRECSDLVPNVRVLCCRGGELTEPVDWVIGRAVRLDDLLAPGLAVAANLAFLVGSDEKGVVCSHPMLGHQEAIALPWGEARWLVTASVKR